MLIGIAIGIVVMAVLFLCVYIGYKLKDKPVIVVKTQQELDEMKKREQGVMNVLDFDYDVAMGIRKTK